MVDYNQLKKTALTPKEIERRITAFRNYSTVLNQTQLEPEDE